ncbi:MAG: immunoglobulin domain-containing protein [Bacteroidales bacterium]|nr:immunoglobulin domain-containing protein [Bacteroidales bacterium]
MSRFITIFLGLFLLFFVSNSINVFAQAPSITTQPSSILECVGSEAVLKIIATGEEPLTYEWYQDGTPLGVNASELPFVALTIANGGEYYCNISNTHGNINSDTVNITVIENAPVINSISTENDLVCVGTDNVLTVDYEGPTSYVKWYFEGSYVDYGTPIDYAITNAQQSNEGNYYCEVYNACGSVTSNTVSIDVVNHANIVTQPTSQTICQGENALLNPVAEGDYLNYKWLADDIMIPDETNSELTITNLTHPHTIEYKFVVYNVCHSDTSNGVYITVNTLPNITGQPGNHQTCFGENVTLYATATTTTDTVTFQWYDENNQIIDGATGTSLDIELMENDTVYHYCAITNECGTVYTDTAEIVSLMPPTITQQPVGDELCVGDDISMQIKAIGFEPISYQWLFNTADVSGTNISGGDAQVISISEISEGQGGVYSCHVSNQCGSTISDEAIVTVNTPPLVTEQPIDIELCAEEELSIVFNQSGTQPISYEWRILGSENAIGTEANYYNAFAEATNSGAYYCLLSNTCATISTDTISVNILALPQVISHPQDETVCVGEYASMEIEAEGAEPLEFLWYRNGSAASGQTNNVLEYVSAQVNQTGEYFCRVSNECGYDDSGTAILTIGTEPAITWHPIDYTLCENDTLNLIMSAQGDNYTLQWYFNDSPLFGENDTVLNIINIPSSMAGTYYCSAFNSCATVYTDTVEVVIHPAPEMSLGNDIDLCNGESTTIAPTGDYVHYNWNNGLSYQPSLDVQLSGTYILEVTGENSCKNRDTLIVSFHPYHQILFEDTEIIACGPYTLDAGEGAYEYIWDTDPTETSSSILITESGTYSVTATGDAYGCSTSHEAYVDVREPINIDLGEDRSVPVNSYVDIGVEDEFAQYIWNTSFNGPILTVYGSNYGVGEHDFWLTVIAQNSCTATDSIKITFWDNSGIDDETTNEGILIFPNPAKDYLTISDVSYNIENIEIINATGQIITSFLVNSNEITLNLSNFAKGIYFLKLKRNNEVITRKIFIR